MHPNLFLLSIAIILIVNLNFPAPLLAYDYRYTNCIQPFSCGGISDVTYPFWGGNHPKYCGLSGLELTCEEDDIPRILMEKKTKYRIIDFSSNTRTLTVVRDDYYGTICPTFFSNSSIDFSNFNYASDLSNITIFYKCSNAFALVSVKFNCEINTTTLDAYAAIKDSEINQLIGASCSSSVKVTVANSAADAVNDGEKDVVEAINGGFGLQWKSSTDCNACMKSGGICGFNSSLNSFACFCYDQPSNTTCSSKPPGKKSWKLWLGIGAAAAILLILATYCLIRRKNHMTLSPWKKTQADLKVEAFLREYGSLAPKRYMYSEIKKMTDSFKEKLGQGGFGAVYKGKSPNGCLVAVKLLNISKGNGEDFINEVASISRTSHVNVVTLLGFCLQGRKRALVYEFMPNGSLEKFIFNKKTTVQASHQLGWEKLYHILVGIARGLEYLHRGCNTRILHFDIKPHNILLDDDFSPKISDFGLAKLCSAKDSKISMLEARGTIGYIAPEVFSRNFGPVSHKSDVYSYGMMVLEMVGGRKNLDVGVSDLSEMYFPHWIYKRLELGAEFQGLQGVTTGKETEIVKKMILVGLWCIQTNPSDRPAISKVIEMLEGNIEALEIPPRPFLSSPPRSPPTQSISDSTSISTSKILEIS